MKHVQQAPPGGQTQSQSPVTSPHPHPAEPASPNRHQQSPPTPHDQSTPPGQGPQLQHRSTSSVMSSHNASESPQPPPTWTEMTTVNNQQQQQSAYMSSMTSQMPYGLPPMSHYHSSWYNQQMTNNQSCMS